jgi:O-antigen/teichoic acid export membrane protein
MILNKLVSASTISGLINVYKIHFFSIFLSLGSNILIAKTLMPLEKGAVDAFNLFVALLVEIGGLGVTSGITHYYNNYSGSIQVFKNTIKLLILMIILSFTALGIVSYLLEGLIGETIFFKYLGYIILTSIFLFVRNISSSMLVASGRVVLSQKIAFYYSALLFLLTFILFLGDIKIILPFVIATAFATLVVGLYSLKILEVRVFSREFDFELIKKFACFGFPIYIGLLINATHFRVDQFFILKLIGTADLSFYTVAVRWAEMIFLFDNLLISYFLNQIIRRSEPESVKLIKKILKLQAFIYLVIFISCSVIMYYILPWLYIPAYERSYLPMMILLFGVAFWSFAKTYSQFITYKKNDNYSPTYFALAALILNVTLNYFLIPRYGIVGCAVSSFFSYFLVYFLSRRRFNLMQKEVS